MTCFNDHKRDIVDEAQRVMNSNNFIDNKNLISSLANEIVACRAEIERLESDGHKRLPIRPVDDRIEIVINTEGRLEARWRDD